MKKIRLEMDVPEETWRKCAVQAAEAGLTFEELVKRMVTDLGDDDQECHAEASSWMAACVSLTFTGATFLSYLDSRHELWDAIGIHNSLQDCVSDLNNNDPVDQIDIRKNIVYLSAKLREHYYCYQTW